MKPRYRRMLNAMAQGDVETGPKTWNAYVVRCCDGTYYTGIAKNVAARIQQHNAGKGATYTRTHRPIQLLYVKDSMTHSEALIYEAKIKKLPRSKKEKLISGNGKSSNRNPTSTSNY